MIRTFVNSIISPAALSYPDPLGQQVGRVGKIISEIYRKDEKEGKQRNIVVVEVFVAVYVVVVLEVYVIVDVIVLDLVIVLDAFVVLDVVIVLDVVVVIDIVVAVYVVVLLQLYTKLYFYSCIRSCTFIVVYVYVSVYVVVLLQLYTQLYTFCLQPMLPKKQQFSISRQWTVFGLYSFIFVFSTQLMQNKCFAIITHDCIQSANPRSWQ